MRINSLESWFDLVISFGNEFFEKALEKNMEEWTSEELWRFFRSIQTEGADEQTVKELMFAILKVKLRGLLAIMDMVQPMRKEFTSSIVAIFNRNLLERSLCLMKTKRGLELRQLIVKICTIYMVHPSGTVMEEQERLEVKHNSLVSYSRILMNDINENNVRNPRVITASDTEYQQRIYEGEQKENEASLELASKRSQMRDEDLLNELIEGPENEIMIVMIELLAAAELFKKEALPNSVLNDYLLQALLPMVYKFAKGFYLVYTVDHHLELNLINFSKMLQIVQAISPGVSSKPSDYLPFLTEELHHPKIFELRNVIRSILSIIEIRAPKLEEEYKRVTILSNPDAYDKTLFGSIRVNNSRFLDQLKSANTPAKKEEEQTDGLVGSYMKKKMQTLLTPLPENHLLGFFQSDDGNLENLLRFVY